MQQSSIRKTQSIERGLALSMAVSVACIGAIGFLWYTMLLPGSPLRELITTYTSSKADEGASSEQHAGEGSENGINTAAQPRAADASRDTIEAAIIAQQQQYTHARQAAQRDPNFQPENRIPQFFKTFHGDMKVLRRE